MYVAKELWHGRSAREPSAKDVGRSMWRSVNELMLVRYGFAFVNTIDQTACDILLLESHKAIRVVKI